MPTILSRKTHTSIATAVQSRTTSNEWQSKRAHLTEAFPLCVFEVSERMERLRAVFVDQIADYGAALVRGDLGTVRAPMLFVFMHSLLLGCLLRPRTDTLPDGKGRRRWYASLALHLALILGGTTVTSVMLGMRPPWMANDATWLLYSLGWFVAGLPVVRRIVLSKPLRVCFHTPSHVMQHKRASRRASCV